MQALPRTRHRHRGGMMKGTGKKQSWMVEVRPGAQEFGGWIAVSTCPDRETALAVADALHNLSGCREIALAPFRVRTKAKGKAGTGGE